MVASTMILPSLSSNTVTSMRTETRPASGCNDEGGRSEELPGERRVEAAGKVPVGDGAKDLAECVVVERVDGDDVQVAGEAAWRFTAFR